MNERKNDLIICLTHEFRDPKEKKKNKKEKARTTEKEYHPNSQTKKRRHPILKEGRWPATAKRRKTSLLLGENRPERKHHLSRKRKGPYGLRQGLRPFPIGGLSISILISEGELTARTTELSRNPLRQIWNLNTIKKEEAWVWFWHSVKTVKLNKKWERKSEIDRRAGPKQSELRLESHQSALNEAGGSKNIDQENQNSPP